jgi:hypothetical protein
MKVRSTLFLIMKLGPACISSEEFQASFLIIRLSLITLIFCELITLQKAHTMNTSSVIMAQANWTLILLCIVLKHSFRRFFSVLPCFRSKELRDRVMFLTEHVVFSCWAYYCIYYAPELDTPGSSW